MSFEQRHKNDPQYRADDDPEFQKEVPKLYEKDTKLWWDALQNTDFKQCGINDHVTETLGIVAQSDILVDLPSETIWWPLIMAIPLMILPVLGGCWGLELFFKTRKVANIAVYRPLIVNGA